MRRLKLIWDFRGPVSQQTGLHHEIHLKEYALAEGLTASLTGTETYGEMHTIAFLVVNESEMPAVRDALKPHRGQLYEEK